METLDLMVAGACAMFAHVVLRLWRNRRAPGAVPFLLLFIALAGHLVTALHREPSLIAIQLGLVASALVPPLLFTAVAEFAGLALPGWKVLRWLVAPAVAMIAMASLISDTHGIVAAIAAEHDPLARADQLQEARRSLLVSTTWSGYAFALLTLVVAVWTVFKSPTLRRDMLTLAVVPALVAVADTAHHLIDFTVGGVLPMPFAMIAGAVVATAAVYRSDMLDLRPMARSVLIDSVVDGMLVVDARRRIVDCNRAAVDILGKSRDEFLRGRAPEKLPRELNAMLQSPVHLRSELLVRAFGQGAWFEVDVTPLTLHGEAAGHLLVARDISERRLAQQALEESRRALETANARLVEQSVTDPLTGLKNRRFLFQRLNEEMSRHQRSGALLGLLLADLDHFKRVNDTHGHPVGDEALVQVAETLTAAVRDCDVVARLGGEEFAVLALNTDAPGLLSLAERVREAIARIPVARHTDRPILMTTSIGVAFASGDIRSAESLFAAADRNLYVAKHQGRNRVVAATAPAAAERAN